MLVKKGDLITESNSLPGTIKVIAAGIDFSYTHAYANRKRNTITISGSGANAGFINFWREEIFASDCITVRGKNDTETLLLLHYLKLVQAHILKQAKGSAQPHVYPSDIKVLNYIVPPTTIVEQFGKLVIPLNEKIANNLNQNQQLSQLRDWLLPMLMNGQVSVADAYQQAAQALSMAAEDAAGYGKAK
jgi:type I restriction enzyme, S subunit